MDNFSLGSVAVLGGLASMLRALVVLQLVWGFILGFAIGMVMHAFLNNTPQSVSPQSVDGEHSAQKRSYTTTVVYAVLAVAFVAFVILLVFSTLRF